MQNTQKLKNTSVTQIHWSYNTNFNDIKYHNILNPKSPCNKIETVIITKLVSNKIMYIFKRNAYSISKFEIKKWDFNDFQNILEDDQYHLVPSVLKHFHKNVTFVVKGRKRKYWEPNQDHNVADLSTFWLLKMSFVWVDL